MDLKNLMDQVEKLHAHFPFMGSRQITRQPRRQGLRVHRIRIQRLMRQMGIYGVVPGPHTSKAHPRHPVYPYLLRDIAIERPNQVWSTDITYIPFRKGFFYLVAVSDWYSRKVLSWRISTTLDERFCLAALDEALGNYGAPEIFNSDQRNHLTATTWVDRLKAIGVAISMAGKGRALDNVITKRFWRTVKYEWIYLNLADDGFELENGISDFTGWYHAERGHSEFDDSTPDERYSGGSSSLNAA